MFQTNVANVVILRSQYDRGDILDIDIVSNYPYFLKIFS
jgi:hypothetical protein